MKNLFLILFFFLCKVSLCQLVIQGDVTDAFQGDTLYNSPNEAFNDKAKVRQINKSKSKFEIRLYTHRSLSNTTVVRIISIEDTTWQAIELNEKNRPISIKRKKLFAIPNFETVIKKLLSYNILNLPNQKEIEYKMRKDTIELVDGEYQTITKKVDVMDGESYSIEIKIGDKFRIYRFENPDTYLKYYPKVNELENYANIIRTFERELMNNNR
ncbi:MAG: hypothetical protein QM737_16055 [Ferruginibacter sp.]